MRKTWMKRLITVTLAAVMAAGTLAGCQSGASNAGGNASEPSAQSSDAPASKAEKAEAGQTTGAAAGQTSEKKDGPSDPMDYSTAKINWRAYEGETLRLLLLEHSATDALKPHLDEFTELTGIEVKLETLPEIAGRVQQRSQSAGRVHEFHTGSFLRRRMVQGFEGIYQ